MVKFIKLFGLVLFQNFKRLKVIYSIFISTLTLAFKLVDIIHGFHGASPSSSAPFFYHRSDCITCVLVEDPYKSRRHLVWYWSHSCQKRNLCNRNWFLSVFLQGYSC